MAMYRIVETILISVDKIETVYVGESCDFGYYLFFSR